MPFSFRLWAFMWGCSRLGKLSFAFPDTKLPDIIWRYTGLGKLTFASPDTITLEYHVGIYWSCHFLPGKTKVSFPRPIHPHMMAQSMTSGEANVSFPKPGYPPQICDIPT